MQAESLEGAAASAPGGGGGATIAHDAARLPAVDALRAGAMLLVIALHAAIPYMDLPLQHVPWVIRDGASSAALSHLFWWLHGFLMPLFFLLAGFCAAALHARDGSSAFLRQRIRRLVVPLLIGGLALLPLTFFVFAAGWWLGGECTWNDIRRMRFQPAVQAELYGPAHLWFLEYLSLYCGLVWAARARRGNGGARDVGSARHWINRALASAWRPVWFAVPTGLLLAADIELFTSHHNSFVPAPLGFLYYGLFFAGGTQLYGWRDGLQRLAPRPALYLIASLPLFACIEWLVRAHRAAPLSSAGRLLLAAAVALFAWLSLFGWFGVFVNRFGRPRPSLRKLADASYWVYLIHLPLLAAFQIAAVAVPVPLPVKFLSTAVLTAALCVWSYERWVRDAPLGALLNGRAAPAQPSRAWRRHRPGGGRAVAATSPAAS